MSNKPKLMPLLEDKEQLAWLYAYSEFDQDVFAYTFSEFLLRELIHDEIFRIYDSLGVSENKRYNKFNFGENRVIDILASMYETDQNDNNKDNTRPRED